MVLWFVTTFPDLKTAILVTSTDHSHVTLPYQQIDTHSNNIFYVLAADYFDWISQCNRFLEMLNIWCPTQLSLAMGGILAPIEWSVRCHLYITFPPYVFTLRRICLCVRIQLSNVPNGRQVLPQTNMIPPLVLCDPHFVQLALNVSSRQTVWCTFLLTSYSTCAEACSLLHLILIRLRYGITYSRFLSGFN